MNWVKKRVVKRMNMGKNEIGTVQGENVVNQIVKDTVINQGMKGCYCKGCWNL